MKISRCFIIFSTIIYKLRINCVVLVHFVHLLRKRLATSSQLHTFFMDIVAICDIYEDIIYNPTIII